MVPSSPTAQPWEASGNETPWKDESEPEFWGVHVAPPSAVATTTAPAPPVMPPTAQAWEASGEQTLLKYSQPKYWDCCTHVAPPSVVARIPP